MHWAFSSAYNQRGHWGKQLLEVEEEEEDGQEGGGESVGMVGRKDEIIKREKWIERKITFCRYMKKTKVRVITPHMFIWHAQHSWGVG